MHSLKVSRCVLFTDLTEDNRSGHSLSYSSEVREEPGHIVFAEKKNQTKTVVKHPKITANHKNTNISS